MANNPYISQITLPTGSTYDIKDAEARDLIAALHNWSYVVATDAATTPQGVQWDDDGTTITGTLLPTNATMYKIYLVPSDESANDIYAEYVTINPSESTYSWEMFGTTKLPDLSQYLSKAEAGDLAYKNSVAGTLTDYVTGGSGSFTGTAATLTTTPAGSVSVSTLGTTAQTATVSPDASGTATYTPAGSVTGTFTGSATQSTGTFTPEGSVAAPTITKTVAGATTNVTGIASVGTLPSATMPTYTVANEVLTITAGSFSAGTLPEAAAAVACKTGDATYEASAPAFTGSAGTVNVSGTPEGSISAAFSGTGVRLVTSGIDVPSSYSATFTGSPDSISYTPAGSVTVDLTTGTKPFTAS